MGNYLSMPNSQNTIQTENNDSNTDNNNNNTKVVENTDIYAITPTPHSTPILESVAENSGTKIEVNPIEVSETTDVFRKHTKN